MIALTRNTSLRILTALLLVAATTTGCSQRAFWTTLGIAGAAAAGAGAVYYVKGDLETDLDGKIGKVHEASLKTVKERGYVLESEQLEDTKGVIKANIAGGENERDRTLTIKTKADGAQTHISIRVGIGGDQVLSNDILNEIRLRAN